MSTKPTAMIFAAMVFVMGAATAKPVDAAELQGSWSGTGYVNPSGSKRESVRCRVTYRRQTAKVYSVRAVCATASVKVNQTGEVLRINNNRYVGDFYNRDFDVSGRVRVSISGSRQTVTFLGARGRGQLTLYKR